MRRYHIKKAEFHFNQIKDYYRHAGINGYHQALYDMNKLFELMQGALKSKNEEHVTPRIGDMIKSAQII